jgi:hypothetical protein
MKRHEWAPFRNGKNGKVLEICWRCGIVSTVFWPDGETRVIVSGNPLGSIVSEDCDEAIVNGVQSA